MEPLWNHTWSLAVEEHFYLGAGLLLWLSSRRGQAFRGLPLFFGLVALALLGLRVLAASQDAFAAMIHLYPTHLRVDSLLFGVLLAYLRHRDHSRMSRLVRRQRWPLLLAGLLLVTPPFVWPLYGHPALYTLGLTSIYLGFGALLGRVGFDSYSVYLWHMPFLAWGLPRLRALLGVPRDSWLELLLFVVGSCVVGIAMARVVEQPFLRLRDRLLPSRSPAMRLPAA